MVAQQVLRVAPRSGLTRHLVALLGFAAVMVAPTTRAHADEDVVIIDLRPGDSAQLDKSRGALCLELGKVQGIRVLGGAAMDAALRGQADEAFSRRGKTALTTAALAYGRLDCAAALRDAKVAVINYAALQATKKVVIDPLRRAYVYTLLCAHNAGDKQTAATAASRLRALGFTTPPIGVSADIWNKYPAAITAPVPVPGAVPVAPPTQVGKGELEITAPVGARVWIDHTDRGSVPIKLTLPVGEHIVAVANASGAAAQLTKVKTGRTSIPMVIQGADPKWEPIRSTIAGWKTASRIVSTKRFAELLRQLKVRFALVFTGNKVAVWGIQKYRKTARRLGAAAATKPVELGALVTDHASAWDGRAPDPSMPLLTEGNTKKLTKKPHKWWVYAGIVGAVALGAAVIIANDSADDSQRVILTFP